MRVIDIQLHVPSATVVHQNSVLLILHPIDRPAAMKEGSVTDLALLFGENPQAVAYSAQPLCWSD